MIEMNQNANKGNMLTKVRSKYILKQIFENLKERILLGIILYNKGLKNRLDIGINNYKNYSQPLPIKEFKTNPRKINGYNIYLNDAGSSDTFSDNEFIIFKSLNNKYYLVYVNKSNSIIAYDIFENKIFLEIEQERKITTSCFSHYRDNNKKRDLIMSIEPISNDIKIWNFTKNFQLIRMFHKINKHGYLNTANFFTDDNIIYIMTSNHRYTGKNVEPIKIYDLKGNKIKELKDSNENVSFLDSYHDRKINKKYIIAAFSRYIRVYNFNENSIYNVYKDKYNPFHRNVIVNDNDDKLTKLIESSSDGYIRIWDFHKAKLIKRILINNNKESVFGFCLWNNECIFAGVKDDIVLLNINTEEIYSRKDYGKSNIIVIKKLNHPEFGECFLTKSKGDHLIKIWIRKDE